tara:strand:- start:403 stop:627 length:225 start_codon:yes stop_codon:yes gene_type:complete
MISMAILFWVSIVFAVIFTLKMVFDSLNMAEVIIWLAAITGLVISCYFRYDKPKEQENAKPTVTVEAVEVVETE